jgi:hypothetical protein
MKSIYQTYFDSSCDGVAKPNRQENGREFFKPNLHQTNRGKLNMKRITLITTLIFLAIPLHIRAEGFENNQQKEDAERKLRVDQYVNEIVGQVFYAYFPRSDCKWAGAIIYSTPSVNGEVTYWSDTPKRFVVEQYIGIYPNFYKIKIEDGSVGYIRETLRSAYYDAYAMKKDEALKESCYLRLSPDELKAHFDQIESFRLATEQAAKQQAKQQEDETQKKVAAETLVLIKKAPALLKKYSAEDICTTYGEAIRGETIYKFEGVPNISKLVINEARRRNLVFNDSLVKKEHIKVGMTECQLYASWGFPSEQNRTVGSWGVHIQHVYDGNYAYTENGMVTSFQN